MYIMYIIYNILYVIYLKCIVLGPLPRSVGESFHTLGAKTGQEIRA